MMVERISRVVKAVIRERGFLAPRELLESMADVFFIPLPNGRIRGVSYFADPADRPLVVIDAKLSGPARDGTMLHEAGHLEMHAGANRIFMQASTLALPDKYEAEADVFSLLYIFLWDPDALEECGRDSVRFTLTYGLPKAVPYVGQVLEKCGEGV